LNQETDGMRLITERQVQQYVTIEAIIASIELAFKALDRGQSAIFPVVSGTGSDPANFIGVKSGRDGSTGMFGVKAGAYNPFNRQRGMKTHTSVTLLIDDLTSTPVAVVQADYLNGMRTAAADALAVRELARADAATLGVIGAGSQAVFEIEAIMTVRKIERVLAGARSLESGENFARRVQEKLGLRVELASIEETVRDILVTVTPSTTPLFDSAWVRPGTHISAMGADNVGKMELPVDLVAVSQLYVDYPDQAALIGEAQHVFNAGHISLDQLRERSLGALLNGRVAGRLSPDAITVFDSSGIAVQDVAAAQTAVTIVSAAEPALTEDFNRP
jgi:alanine dehydrogenase